MVVLSPEGREALKSYLEDLRNIKEAMPYVVYHDIHDDETQTYYRERILKARFALLTIRKHIDPCIAVIKEFLFALDDQEVLTDKIGEVEKIWDFCEQPLEPDETNPL